jgi:hypothetical protein
MNIMARKTNPAITKVAMTILQTCGFAENPGAWPGMARCDMVLDLDIYDLADDQKAGRDHDH